MRYMGLCLNLSPPCFATEKHQDPLFIVPVSFVVCYSFFATRLGALKRRKEMKLFVVVFALCVTLAVRAAVPPVVPPPAVVPPGPGARPVPGVGGAVAPADPQAA